MSTAGTTTATVAAAGTVFTYREAGSGPPAVLLHGFGMDGRMWDPLLRRLRTPRRCVALDMRGAGATPPDPPASTLERHADDVAAVLEAWGVVAADMVGFSMGGFVLLALLERHPALVRSAAFVGARANADDGPTRAGRDALIRTLHEQGHDAGFAALLPKLVGPGAAPAVRERLRTMFADQPIAGLVTALAAMRARPDRLAVLADVTAPVLVVAGQHDAFAPPPLPGQMAAMALDARLETIPAVGHTMPLEAPAALAALLDAFWQR